MTEHSVLGASSAHRWMHCGGSIHLSAKVPGTGESEHSREGTAAHKLLELALAKHLPASTWVGTTLEQVKVTEEMAEAVQECLDIITDLQKEYGDSRWGSEERVSLAALKPPGPMFGTVDYWQHAMAEKVLIVLDYKHGQGVKVEALDNPQALYYALALLLKLQADEGPGCVEKIRLVIVQPRCPADTTVRYAEVNLADLLEFADALLEAAEKALDPAAPLNPGSWCRFCRAQPICPAQKSVAIAAAQVDFLETTDTAPLPAALPIETLIKVMQQKPVIEAWFKAVETHLYGELNAGREVPGYKLVQMKPRRVWGAQEAQVRLRLEELGLSPEDYLSTELKSPPGIEKVLGKNKMDQINDLIVKKSSGTTIAPLSDTRAEAPVGAQVEFTLVDD